MAGASGQGTTFNLPNFEGPLYGISPEDHPFLSMLGGLYGGEPVNSTVFSWQEYDLRAAAVRAALEGANAPTAENRVRGNVKNVLQIVHEAIDVSYTKGATANQVQDVGSAHPNISGTGQGNPVRNEYDWQVEQALKQVARDMEYSLINGTFVEPANNSTARKTRGIVEAITTNAVNAATATGLTADVLDTSAATTEIWTSTGHGFVDRDEIAAIEPTANTTPAIVAGARFWVDVIDANTFYLHTSPTLSLASRVIVDTAVASLDFRRKRPLTASVVKDAMQLAWDNGGLSESETATLMVNSWNKRKLSEAFITGANYQEMSRNVGGVNVQTIETDFGRVNVVLNRYVPVDTIVVVSLDQCRLKWLGTEKGTFFMEPLAKIGASDRSQLYGEFGLEYGNQLAHAKITDLNSAGL